MFLQGSGTMLAIPFLPSLLPREAWAQSTAAPKRFISIFSDLDYGHNSQWLPNGLTNITNIPQPSRVYAPGGGHHDIRWQPLRDFAPTATSSLSNVYGTSVSPYLDQVTIMRSVDYGEYRGHDSARLLGGARLYSQNEAMGSTWRPIPTIDSFMNSNRTFNPAGLPLMSGGTDTGPSGNTWTYAAASGNAVSVIESQSSMNDFFNSLFRSGSFPESGSTTPTHPRRAILNTVLEDFRRVVGSRNISSVDKQALTNAMDKLNDVYNGLAQGSSGQCSYKGLTRNLDITQSAYIGANGKQLADMITAAIMCDSGRVFTIGIHGGDRMYQATPVANVDIHQNMSHTPFAMYNGIPAYQHLASIQARAFQNFVRPLIQNLASAIDPANGRSYLYNSLVYCAAAAGQTHGSASAPVMLVGNAGGALTSGNYIDYANRARGAVNNTDSMNASPGDARFSNNWAGVSYNRLMVTILQAMGFTPAQYEDNTLNQQLYNNTTIGTQNRGLTAIGGWGYASTAQLSRGDYFAGEARGILSNQDLTQYRNRLPFPT